MSEVPELVLKEKNRVPGELQSCPLPLFPSLTQLPGDSLLVPPHHPFQSPRVAYLYLLFSGLWFYHRVPSCLFLSLLLTSSEDPCDFSGSPDNPE